MNDPATTNAPVQPGETVESMRLVLEHYRQRAVDLHTASDRAASTRYAERGAALDDATRAAKSARQEATTAQQQAQHERDEALSNKVTADDLDDISRKPGSDVRFAQQQAAHYRALEHAAEQRAERLERRVTSRSARRSG